MTMFEISDFWWLAENEVEDELFVGIGHHPPLNDDNIPMSLDKWFHSLDKDLQLSCTYIKYPLVFIERWRAICNNTNVYRTLKLFTRDTGQPQTLGPFLLDIDNEQENLDDALVVARNVVDFLTINWNLKDCDIHIFFSGRKGFNIEIRPQGINILGSTAEQLKSSALQLKEIKNHFGASSRGTLIDPVYGDRFDNYRLKHPYIRLHGSWNKWIGENGICKARRRIELTLQELASLTADEICTKAEKPK